MPRNASSARGHIPWFRQAAKLKIDSVESLISAGGVPMKLCCRIWKTLRPMKGHCDLV